MACCLLLPAAGSTLSVSFILSYAASTSNDLEMAARAGTLVMVVRSAKRSPANGDSVENAILASPETAPTPTGISWIIPPELFLSLTTTNQKSVSGRSGLTVKHYESWTESTFGTQDEPTLNEVDIGFEVLKGYALRYLP
jgi:hypothetical protein